MKTILLDANGKNISINQLDVIEGKINTLISLRKQNPVKGVEDNFSSLMKSEMFNSLYTEGHISSRKTIGSIVDKSNVKSDDVEYKGLKLYLQNYFWILDAQPKFTIANCFHIYNTLASFWIGEKNQLKEDELFRSEPVFIKTEMKEYEGFNPLIIKDSLTNLFQFLNDETINVYIRAILGHLYFELVHPYYDLNGRTGRYIPFWVFANNGQPEEMMYFSNATGNYRDTYMKAFKEARDSKINQINADIFLIRVLDLLILNQKQFLWYFNIKQEYINKTKKNLTLIQKTFIWEMMIKYENQGNANSWCKLSSDDMKYFGKDLIQSQFSRDVNILKEHGLIDISETRPAKYKLNGYSLKK